MKVKLDIYKNNPNRMSHITLDESQLIEAINLYLLASRFVCTQEVYETVIDEIILD